MLNIDYAIDRRMTDASKTRREIEQDLLAEIQKAQQQFYEGTSENRAAALEKYHQTVNQFSEFVLGDDSSERK